MHPSKAKQGVDSLFPMGRQVFGHLQESRVPSCVMVIWENKHCHSKGPPSPPLLYTGHDATWSGISPWSAGVTCPGSVSSHPPMHSHTLMAAGEADKALALCKSCSATTKASLHYQPCVQQKNPKLSPKSATMKKTTPAKTSREACQVNLIKSIKQVY